MVPLIDVKPDEPPAPPAAAPATNTAPIEATVLITSEIELPKNGK